MGTLYFCTLFSSLFLVLVLRQNGFGEERLFRCLIAERDCSGRLDLVASRDSPNNMCAQRNPRSALVSAQSDQFLCCPHEDTVRGTLATHIARS